jgi:hypothetical protein
MVGPPDAAANDAVVVVVVVVVLPVGPAGQPPPGTGLRSPCFLWADQAFSLIVIWTHGFCSEPVRWQMVILS